ncbi:hypothetical protein RRG08_027200 [Elysia crispata]|uniref:Uncharacterized protein n=1 Tax=Elysia crispata TaxID=231223 RepID=A0AAE1DT20_9GAST|nr:hypothetical protein RRG08_027200 [Elysia crispata]
MHKLQTVGLPGMSTRHSNTLYFESKDCSSLNQACQGREGAEHNTIPTHPPIARDSNSETACRFLAEVSIPTLETEK